MLTFIALAAAQDPALPTRPVDTDATTADPPSDPPADDPPADTPDGGGEPAAQPEVFEIPPLRTPLPSATRRLNELENIGEDELASLLEEAGLDPELFDRPALVRGAWFVRPRLAFQQLVRDGEDGSAVRLGLSAGRRWWTMEALPVQVAADVQIRATAPIGEAVGRRVEAVGHVGPWLGPVRVELGMVLRWEKERWLGRSLTLDDALFLGPELGVGLDADVLQLSVGVQPSWRLAGERPPAKDGDPVMPAFADETVWTAAIGVPLVPIGFTVDGSWRDTVIGGNLEIGLSLQLAFGKGD